MTGNHRKESDNQAASGFPDPELDSLVAPQGYAPDFVDEVAGMDTPADQRRQAIRFMVIMLILVGLGFWFCTPANLVIPGTIYESAPYGLDDRPAVPTDKFLEDILPRTVGEFTLVDLKKEQSFVDPYIGAHIVRATYVDELGNPVSVVMTQADSYINARRYLENYKRMLYARTEVTAWQERFYINQNYILWEAPSFAEQAYGLAWNNDSHFISVTSPVSSAQAALAAAFPY